MTTIIIDDDDDSDGNDDGIFYYYTDLHPSTIHVRMLAGRTGDMARRSPAIGGAATPPPSPPRACVMFSRAWERRETMRKLERSEDGHRTRRACVCVGVCISNLDGMGVEGRKDARTPRAARRAVRAGVRWSCSCSWEPRLSIPRGEGCFLEGCMYRPIYTVISGDAGCFLLPTGPIPADVGSKNKKNQLHAGSRQNPRILAWYNNKQR